MSSSFYADLTPFSAFEEFHDPRHYRPVPADWQVYVTDIVDSTGAIAAGRYKDVNTIGAASITCVLTQLPGVEFPFVFGGDGATLCVPPEHAMAVDDALGRLITLARANFGFELRVARIPIAELAGAGFEVLVAKFALAAGNPLACFRGGGLAEADRLAKDGSDRYAIASVPVPTDELIGLSCRWSPIPSRRGCVVTLIVRASSTDPDATYAAVIQTLQRVLGTSLEAANPISLDHVRYTSVWRAWRDEVRFHGSFFRRAVLDRLISIISTVLIFRPRRDVAQRFFDRRRYIDAVPAHCDYRKFDDTLRLVLDCTPVEADAMESALAHAQSEGALHFGMHRAREALMTCFVRSTQDGEHLHFVDGGTGGFALAARQLKARVSGEFNAPAVPRPSQA